MFLKNLFIKLTILMAVLICTTAMAQKVDSLDDNKTYPVASTQQKVLILLGAPGSGKGTQAVQLSKELNLPHISTGDLFRQNLKDNTELGKKAKSYMDAGKLVPDEIVQAMLFERIAEKDAAAGYILDGFPRTIAQAKVLDAKLKQDKARVLVVNLEVPDEVLIERIVERGKANSGKRKDDTKEIAQKRLKVYHEETEPLVSHYQTKGLLVTINGEQAPEQILKTILEAYKKRRGMGQ